MGLSAVITYQHLFNVLNGVERSIPRFVAERNCGSAFQIFKTLFCYQHLGFGHHRCVTPLYRIPPCIVFQCENLKCIHIYIVPQHNRKLQ